MMFAVVASLVETLKQKEQVVNHHRVIGASHLASQGEMTAYVTMLQEKLSHFSSVKDYPQGGQEVLEEILVVLV